MGEVRSKGGLRVCSGEGEGEVGARSAKRVQTVAEWHAGPRGGSEGPIARRRGREGV